jgi:hypothetical protein
MSKRIVVIGESLLSAMVARALDQKVGGLTHINLSYLTQSPTAVYPHQATIFGHLEKIEKSKLMPHTQIVLTEVKSVNLRDKIVITTQGVVEYDYLVVDQQPTLTEKFWRDLRAELSTLYAQLEGSANLGQEKIAQITLEGFSLDSSQLALAIRRDCLSHRQSRIIVRNYNTRPLIGPFLTASGVRSRERELASNLPGLTLREPRPMVPSDVIKGAKIAHNGSVVVDAAWRVGDRSVIIIPRELSQQINMVSAITLLSRELSRVILPLIEDKKEKEVEIEIEPAIFLQGVREPLLILNNWQSKRFRARFAQMTERFLWERLQNLNW